MNSTMNETVIQVAKPFAYNNLDIPRLDCVLVYSKQMMQEHPKKQADRLAFETAMKEMNIVFKESPHPHNPDKVFLQVYFPFEVLCQEAESIGIQMPIKMKKHKHEHNCLQDLFTVHEDCSLVCTDRPVDDLGDDYISGPFIADKVHAFIYHEKPDIFFRDCLRYFLAHHILINRINIQNKGEGENERLLRKRGLSHLLLQRTYLDFHLVHDPSERDQFLEYVKQKRLHHELPPDPEEDAKLSPEEKLVLGREREEQKVEIEESLKFSFKIDRRKELDQTWKATCCKFQPLSKIRNYFGEQIAFYFAWQGHLITYLWFPVILGIIVFAYGLYDSITEVTDESVSLTTPKPSTLNELIHIVDDMLSKVKSAFDNVLTPFFALVICLWGTIFTEKWKRYMNRIAFDWDVEDFKDVEPDRPEFFPTDERTDPYTGKLEYFYPYKKQFLKFAVSLVVLLVMILVVLIVVAGVIVYRVFITIQVCPSLSSSACVVVNMGSSSLMNAITIVILGVIYERIAYKLTDWENMRTQTAYEDAVILKLFVFQFANCYSSLFYIAFFRSGSHYENGIFNLGPEYLDTCGAGGNCMAMLSIQVLILMLVKPLPKFFKDIILPIIKKLCRKCPCCKKVTPHQTTGHLDPQDWTAHVAYELREKPPLTVFPLSEYMEKIIQYGFLMLFTAAFPLGPVIALLTNVIDNKVDASRLLWLYRRPVPIITQNIGIWYFIIEFVNTCGVISNALLIAFTSNWGKQFSFSTQLIIVIGIEHSVFFLKYFLDVVIPDVPNDVSLDMRRERQLINDMFFDAKYGTLEACPKCNPDYRPKDEPKHKTNGLPSRVRAANTAANETSFSTLHDSESDNDSNVIELHSIPNEPRRPNKKTFANSMRNLGRNSSERVRKSSL